MTDQDAVKCPRCGFLQARTDNCGKCGLFFAKWRGVYTILAEIDDPSVREIVGRMWDGLKNDFENKKLHEEFLEFCDANEILDVSASLYRMYMVDFPDSPNAADFLKKIIFLAQQRMERLQKKTLRDARRAKLIKWTVVAVTLSGFMLIFLWIYKTLPK